MFALCRPKHQEYTPREHPESLAQSDPPPVDLSVGDIRSQIAAEWSQIPQRSHWRAYRKPPSLFRMVPSLTPYDLPFLKNWVPYAPKIRELPYLRNGSFYPLIYSVHRAVIFAIAQLSCSLILLEAVDTATITC